MKLKKLMKLKKGDFWSVSTIGYGIPNLPSKKCF